MSYTDSSEYSFNSDESELNNDEITDITEITKGYKFITFENINIEIDIIISNLQIETNYSYDKILNILIINNWNVETIYSLYLDGKFENTDIELKYEDIECSICYELLTQNNIIKINDCNHLLCEECFISNYSVNLNFKCPMYKCNNICYLSKILKYVDKDIKIKYKNYIIDHYININKLIIYCPSQPFCGNLIIKNLYSESFIIQCKCKEIICFKCKEVTNNHEPATCLMKKKWNKMIINSSIVYINAKCKNCPWCDRICEKVSGCNFLTCNTIKNKYWCWLCGDKVYNTEHTYTSIKGHTCSLINSENSKNTKDQLFYVEKHENHSSSVILDIENFNKIKILPLIGISNTQLDNIIKYYKLIIKSRNYIKNLYIYAYFELDNITNINLLVYNIEMTEYILEFFGSALDKYINNITNDYEIYTIDNNYIEVENQSKLMIRQLNLIVEYLDIIE